MGGFLCENEEWKHSVFQKRQMCHCRRVYVDVWDSSCEDGGDVDRSHDY